MVPDLVPPLAQDLLDELAAALRIVIVDGPRQSGKATMIKQYQRAHGGSYRTLDNRQDQEAALADPVAFAVDGEPPRLIRRSSPGRRLARSGDQDRGRRGPAPGAVHPLRLEPVPNDPHACRSHWPAGPAFVDLWPLSMAEVTGGPAARICTSELSR